MATRNPAKGRRGSQAVDQFQAELHPETPVFPFPKDFHQKYLPFWVDIVNTKAADYWTRGDVTLLKMYCRCAADIERLCDDIENEGEVIINQRGNPVVNPKVVVRGFAEARLMALATKLRMQPSSRVALDTEKNKGIRKKAAAAAARTVDADPDNLLAGGADYGDGDGLPLQ